MKDLSDIAAPGNSGLPWTILGTRSPQRYWLAGEAFIFQQRTLTFSMPASGKLVARKAFIFSREL